MIHIFLFAILKMTFPEGNASEPSAVAPLTPTTEALSFWWDEAAFHAGTRFWAWSELGTQPTNGASFKVDFGVLDGAVDRRRIVLEGRIDRSASRYRIGSFGPIGETTVSNEVTVFAAKAGEVKNRFQAAGPAPDYIEVSGGKKAAPGETVAFRIGGNGSKSGWCNDVLRDADGTELYVADGPYRAAGRKFDYAYLWTDTGTENVHFAAYVWTDEANEAIRITAEDLASGRKVLGWGTKVPVKPAWGKRQYDFSVADLPAGTFKLVFEYLDGKGKVLHSDFARYYKPYGKAPWEGNTLGLEDTVPPPWTKPAFGDDGVFRCWGREIRLGGKGLVSSMVSQGKELLAEPVAIVLDGQALAFEVVGVERKVSEATYRLKATNADVAATVRCEFDGYLRFELDYPAGIGRLEWKVSGNRRLFTVFDDCSGDMNKDVLAKTGGFVRSFDIGKKPWWWMTGRVGVMGGVINLRGAHIADLGKSGTVDVSDERVTVTTRFIDSPLAAGPRRRVRFYLEPTPVKPKDMDFDCLEQRRIRLWTGYLTEYYEVKAPGYELWDRFERYRQEVKQGLRVFFYNSFNGVSPESPFWGRYGWEWTKNDISYYAKEVPLYGEMRKTNNWGYGCPNSRNFLEWKIWGFNWMLNEPVKEMKDLYFDLAEPSTFCRNVSHGCVWTDDFGRKTSDGTFEAIRELAKRSYRLVKAKNADGIIYGHVNKIRTPCDSFFGFNGVGESLDVAMYRNGRTYYDVFTPEMMQALWVPKAQEFSLYVTPQFERTLWRFVGEKAYKAYDPDVPELRTPIRHFLAYVKLHALNIYFSGRKYKEGKFYVPVDDAVKATGPKRAYSAYYLENPTVTLSRPHPRFLWGHFAGNGRQVLILLNDTDETVSETVTVKGLKARGREILDGTPFDFSTGSCTVSFGPREARFIGFTD